jgi:hypothetical protein
MADAPHTPASFWTIMAASASVMAIVLSIVGGVGSIIIGGLKEEIADLKTANADLNVRMAPLLTLNAQVTADKEQMTAMRTEIDKKADAGVFTLFGTTINDRITATERSAADRSKETVDQLHSLEGEIVSRAENQVHWAAVGALELRVNDLSKGACPTK